MLPASRPPYPGPGGTEYVCTWARDNGRRNSITRNRRLIVNCRPQHRQSADNGFIMLYAILKRAQARTANVPCANAHTHTHTHGSPHDRLARLTRRRGRRPGTVKGSLPSVGRNPLPFPRLINPQLAYGRLSKRGGAAAIRGRVRKRSAFLHLLVEHERSLSASKEMSRRDRSR